jgi:hypothetical protein
MRSLLTDFVPGRELLGHLKDDSKFSEFCNRLHKAGVKYHLIKPEDILFNMEAMEEATSTMK